MTKAETATHHLDLRLAKELLDRAVAEKGADYVYDTDPHGCVNFVLNVESGEWEPACIVGWVLYYLGVTSPEVCGRGSGADTALDYLRNDGFLTFTEEAVALLREAQARQDRGIPWGQSVEQAWAERTAS